MLEPSKGFSRAKLITSALSSGRWILVDLAILHLVVLFEDNNKKLQQKLFHWRQLATVAALLYLLLTPLQLGFSVDDSTAQVMGKMLPGPLPSLMLGLAFASGANGMVGQPTRLAALLNPPRLAIKKILKLLGLKQQRTKSIDSYRINPFNSPVNIKIPRKLKFWRNHRQKKRNNLPTIDAYAT